MTSQRFPAREVTLLNLAAVWRLERGETGDRGREEARGKETEEVISKSRGVREKKPALRPHQGKTRERERASLKRK